MTWEPSKKSLVIPTVLRSTKIQQNNSNNVPHVVPKFKKNDLATIRNLKNKPEKNGQIVRIDSSFKHKTQRYNVYLLATNEYAQLKPENLKPFIRKKPQTTLIRLSKITKSYICQKFLTIKISLSNLRK